jgi:hypothetical protein
VLLTQTLQTRYGQKNFYQCQWPHNCILLLTSQKFQEAFAMKKVSRIALSVLAFLFFVSAMGILPSSANSKTGKQAGQEPAPQAQTVSGKIASVDKSSFSINVATGTSNQNHVATNDAGSPKTMHFQIDKNTTVDGQLQVGANADVTYRQDGGNNIAISVHVS